MRTPKAPVEPAEEGLAVDVQSVPPAVDAPVEADAIPEPITAIGDDGLHRPMSGGSFIRQSDGTLVRSDDNG